MSRRTGKAATRRARQQKRARLGPSPTAAPAPSTVPAAPSTESVQATTPTVSSPAPRTPSWTAPGGSSSRLAESARVEYHYVGRDLRNTLVLMVLMGVILAVAVVIVNLSGVIPS